MAVLTVLTLAACTHSDTQVSQTPSTARHTASAAPRGSSAVIGGADSTEPSASNNATGPRSPASTPSPRPAAAVLHSLGDAGIGVVPGMDLSAARLASVVTPEVQVLSAWQVDALSQEAAAGSGIEGNVLNAAFPVRGGPPLSVVLAGWMASGVDADAKAAAVLMGHPDFVHHVDLHYPMFVFQLFLADLARHTTGTPSADAPPPSSSPQSSGAGLRSPGHSFIAAPDLHCGNISAIVNDQLTTLFAALKVDPTAIAGYLAGKIPTVGVVVGTVVGFFASFWNSVVTLAQQSLQGVVDKITAPVIGALRLVFGALALVTTIASYLKAWALPVKSDPDHLLLSTIPRTGKLTSTIDPNTLTNAWPPELVSCAQEYGVQLPKLAQPGDPVTWTVQTHPELVTLDHEQTSLDDHYQTVNGYTTATETAAQAKGAVITYPVVWFKAIAQRSEVTELGQFATRLALSQLPTFLQPVAKPYIDAAVARIAGVVDEIVGVKGTAFVAIGRHSPAPPPGCNGTPGIPAGHYSAAFPVTFTASGTIDLDASTGAVWTVNQRASGSGRVRLTSNGRTVAGTVTVSLAMSTGNLGAPQVGIPDIAHSDGGSTQLNLTVSGPATAPVAIGTAASSGARTTIDIPIPVDPPDPSATAPTSVKVGLHLTSISCTAIAGDVVAMFREIATQTAAKAPLLHMTIGGKGAWTAPRA